MHTVTVSSIDPELLFEKLSKRYFDCVIHYNSYNVHPNKVNLYFDDTPIDCVFKLHQADYFEEQVEILIRTLENVRVQVEGFP